MTETKQEISKIVFDFFYHGGFTDLEQNDDDMAQDLASHLMKKLEPALTTATQQAVLEERERIKLIIREHERADGEIEMYVDDLFMAIHGYRVLALSQKGSE